MALTQEQKSQVKTMQRNGQSYSEIGAFFGMTRNAIGGVVNRDLDNIARRMDDGEGWAANAIPNDHAAAAIAELKFRSCRWPMGDPRVSA